LVVRVGVAVALGVLAALAVPIVLHSDWANTAVRTAAAPRPAGLFPLPATLDRRWQAVGVAARGAHSSGGVAVQGDTVIVAAAHRIEGRDSGTGGTRWFYERRNATLCDWTARDGLVFAAFRKGHGCRDLVALNAGTGARTWYRNAELDTDITLSAMPSVLVAANAHGLVAFDTGGGLNRWTYGKSGCTLSAPVLGDLGVGLLAGCGSTAPRLVLLDAFSGKERFTPAAVGGAARVLSTGQAVALLSGGAQRPTVTLYGQAGTRTGSVTDARLRYDDPGHAGATVYSGLIIGWTGRAVFAVPVGSPRLLWTAPGTGPAGTDTSHAVVATQGGFAEVDLADGRVVRTVQAPHGDAAPAALDRVGALLVVTSADGTAVYG
jgi:hypothetical protein